jgi:hypothetical protein
VYSDTRTQTHPGSDVRDHDRFFGCPNQGLPCTSTTPLVQTFQKLRAPISLIAIGLDECVCRSAKSVKSVPSCKTGPLPNFVLPPDLLIGTDFTDCVQRHTHPDTSRQRRARSRQVFLMSEPRAFLHFQGALGPDISKTSCTELAYRYRTWRMRVLQCQIREIRAEL